MTEYSNEGGKKLNIGIINIDTELGPLRMENQQISFSK